MLASSTTMKRRSGISSQGPVVAPSPGRGLRLPRRYIWIMAAAPVLILLYLVSSSSSSRFSRNAGPAAGEGTRRGGSAAHRLAKQLGRNPGAGAGTSGLHPPLSAKRTFNDAFMGLDGTSWETKMVGGVPGYMMFDNLYTHQGILYAVTSRRDSIPDVSRIVSIGENVADETFWKVITPYEAREIFGSRVARLEGETLFFADGPPTSFLDHYFHFVVECFSGAWRVLASQSKNTALKLSPPQRVIFPREVKWRDGPGLNAWFLGTVIPTAAIEEKVSWDDRAASGNVYSFERIVIVDRWASHRHNPTANQWNKMNADVYTVPAPADWWEPLRQALMYSLQIPDEPLSDKPVITYVNRQGTDRRKIKDEDHVHLMQALYELEAEGHAQVYDARMEHIGKKEQFALSSRTNILIGVHGNGLSHLMWMKKGSSVIEIFYPEGFTRDYQLITAPLGLQHYTIWNDTVRRESEWRQDGENHFPDEFQGTQIPISGPLIKDLILDIIAGTKKYSG